MNQPITGLKLNTDGQVTHALVNDKAIACKHLVASIASVPKAILHEPNRTSRISRAIFLTNKPLQPSEKDEVNVGITALINYLCVVLGVVKYFIIYSSHLTCSLCSKPIQKYRVHMKVEFEFCTHIHVD